MYKGDILNFDILIGSPSCLQVLIIGSKKWNLEVAKGQINAILAILCIVYHYIILLFTTRSEIMAHIVVNTIDGSCNIFI